MDQFLNRLPKVVVKAGRVIDIRDSVKTSLQVRLETLRLMVAEMWLLCNVAGHYRLFLGTDCSFYKVFRIPRIHYL